MPNKNPNAYDYDGDIADLSDMDAGRDAGGTNDPGIPAEMMVAEIGAAGNGVFSDFFVLAFGGNPDPNNPYSGAGKIRGDIQDGTTSPGAQVPAGTQLRLRITDRKREKTITKTRWYNVAEEIEGAPENQPPLNFPGVTKADFAREGRYVAVELKHPSQSFTIDDGSNSRLEFPVVGGN